jgi:AcrR family transcriptional regulator
MSDIVERAEVPFGSLYQYFPDKTAVIGTLAERYNAIGRACVQKELAAVRSARDLHPALCRMVDGFYRMYQDEPVMRSIWQATQADPVLKKLDDDDCKYLAGLLSDALRRFSDADDKAIATFAELTITLVAAAVRQAITLKPKQGREMIAMFKQMLPPDLRALDN